MIKYVEPIEEFPPPSTPVATTGVAVRQGKTFINSTTNVAQNIVYDVNALNGTALFLLTSTNQIAETISSITDSIGNTWTKVAGTDVVDRRFELWKAPNTASAANTITINFVGVAITNAAHRCWIFEVNGLGTLSDGPTNTTSYAAVGAIPGATLAVNAFGIAFTCFWNTVGSISISNTSLLWTESGVVANQAGVWHDLSAASGTRAAVRFLDNTSITLTPLFNQTTGCSGRAFTGAVYGS